MSRTEEQITEMIGKLQDAQEIITQYTVEAQEGQGVATWRFGLTDLVVYDSLHDLNNGGWLRQPVNQVMRQIIERNFVYYPFNPEEWGNDGSFTYELRCNLQEYMPEAIWPECGDCMEPVTDDNRCQRCLDEDEEHYHVACCVEHREEGDG